jgi:butyryl-CoA dehydrogenase
LAIQVHGGYGYTREYPVEQFYRDNRLNPIHEGTHGIQGLDLLGRKVSLAGGRFYQVLMDRIETSIGEARQHQRLTDNADRLERVVRAMAEATDAINAEKAGGDKEKALANATLYLDAFGQVVVGWLWLRQGIRSLAGLSGDGEQTADFYEGKLKACDYFARYELPSVLHTAELLKAVDTTALNMADEEF